MDRFIVSSAASSSCERIYLKSSMDRFIEAVRVTNGLFDDDLKSSMDRFIAHKKSQDNSILCVFKIQYG